MWVYTGEERDDSLFVGHGYYGADEGRFVERFSNGGDGGVFSGGEGPGEGEGAGDFVVHWGCDGMCYASADKVQMSLTNRPAV